MKRRLLDTVLRSAWPSPSIDRLLRAALLQDSATAATEWRAFEAHADFDHLTDGEMRLLGLVSRRLSEIAADSPMRGRIAGIERSNWSRSQLAIGAAGPGLRALEAASLPLMTIKGASRIATGARGRMINDVDILVPPDVVEQAFVILVDNGWRPAGAGTVLYQGSGLAHAVGVNLVQGRFGNLDLHRTAFHPPYASKVEDGSIWKRAAVGKLAYTPVFVPSPSDAITIALAHGALEAHKSSDWLTDIVAGIDGAVDWTLLETLIDRHGLHASAASALRYVQERLQRTIPADRLNRLEAEAYRRPVTTLAALSETRPKGIDLYRLARGVAKQGRLLRSRRRKRVRRPIVFASLFSGRRQKSDVPKVLEQILELPDRVPHKVWKGNIDVTVSFEAPAVTRRIDFEINSDIRHHLRLRVRSRTTGERAFRFKFEVSLQPDEGALIFAAAPSRTFNADAAQEEIDGYGAISFSITDIRIVAHA